MYVCDLLPEVVPRGQSVHPAKVAEAALVGGGGVLSSGGLQPLVELFCEVTRALKQSGGGVFTVRVVVVRRSHVQRWW